jgi:Rrf2 family protein
MRVTKWGECGILCSLYLAKRGNDAPIGASEIAENQCIDLPYTQQILHKLRRGDVIESVRGPRGGYRLKRQPREVSLKDILYAIEGDTFQIICDSSPLHPDSESPAICSTRESCGLHGVWQELRASIDQLLERKTLQDLIEAERSEPLIRLTPRN